ncbi:hypothetical protein BKG82_26955 [Mycobacteroides chelonae]|uniref:HTH gntR-type domain-containing protein n=1 Tax=Mycobacteroides chelonae TaxID=1774 RepID=A0A1S1LCB7_MYCCH|nr:hypothetical protein BKG82_26955 [Mycobacteroides chelonae]
MSNGLGASEKKLDALERKLLDGLRDPDGTLPPPEWKDGNDLFDIGQAVLRGHTAQALGTIDESSSTSIFAQIADLIRAAIAAGQYRDGDRLPSESELMRHFGVARMTIRTALQQLRIDGLVRAEHGRGVFVSEPASRAPAGPLNLDDLVALTDLIERIAGQSLASEQSSRLHRAYHLAQSHAGGATLGALALAAQSL